VRRVRQQAFGGITPDIGYGGHDEDQGQMGAISALMSIGLFNVLGNQSQTPYYEITSPIFDEITIHLNSAYYAGKSFKILTHGNKPTSPYIQKATLNGKDHMSCWFSHEAFAKGGTLELWLGSEPNKKWGVKESLLPIR
jgi:putative alpha-1,2-mannosidase